VHLLGLLPPDPDGSFTVIVAPWPPALMHKATAAANGSSLFARSIEAE
jgi:hypothetical protein